MTGIRIRRHAKRLLLACAGAAVIAGLGAGRLVSAASTKDPLITVGTTQIWANQEDPKSFFYMSKMSVDADGAPTAYHQDNSKALDYLGNAGKPGNWFALITDTGKADGTPLVQGPNDPAPGYYISATSLVMDPKLPESNPKRFVDASTIPYIALPPELRRKDRAALGDVAAVINPKNGKVKYAIFADVGSTGHLGEGSVWLANELQDNPVANPSAKKGGFDGGIIYVVFPGSGAACGNPRTVADIETAGQKLFTDWGGMTQAKAFFP